MNVVVLNGSHTRLSRTAVLIDYLCHALYGRATSIQQFSALNMDAEALLYAHVEHSSVLVYRQAVAQADVVIVASPVYQASFSGCLKLLLDVLPQFGLKHKVVLPLATGGSPSHLLMLDYALKPVLSALGATKLLTSVYASTTDFILDATQAYRLSENTLNRLDSALKEFAEFLPEFFSLPTHFASVPLVELPEVLV